MTRTLALEHAAQLVRQRYEPPGNYHPKGFYISISSLTKKTAKEYAQKLLDWKRGDEHPDNVPKYYAYIGNTLGAEAFADYPHHETQVVWQVNETWFIVGHSDAVKVEIVPRAIHPGGDIVDSMNVAVHGTHERYVVVGEHKFHGENSDENHEAAKRQGHLYLALMYAMHLAAQPDSKHPTEAVQFNIAPYDYIMPDGSRGFDPETMLPLEGAIPKGGNTPFVWEPDMVPGGVVVGIAEARPPGNVSHHEVGVEECLQYIDFYTRKAKKIIECFETDSLKPAEEWDLDEGLLEFARSFEAMNDPPGNIGTLMPLYYEAKQNAEKFEADKSRLGAELMNALKAVGLTKAVDKASGFSVTIVDKSNGERVDQKAIKELSKQPGYEYLRQFVKDGGRTVYALVKQKAGGEE